MRFQEIIGQEDVKKRFIHSVKENRISHAQLLLGPEGSGNLALAIAYAQYICCENRQDDDSCGECPSCLKYQKLIHPDLHFVFPVIKDSKRPKAVSDNFLDKWRETVLSNPYFNLNQWYGVMGAENKQGSIYADESSQIIRKLSLKTFESEYKVMIIWMPEKMNVVASNKLLKMIEEPPAKTLFLLVAEDVGQIIQTILSRTQLVKVPKIDDASLFTTLKEKFSLEDSLLKSIVHLSDGSYVEALENIDTSEDHAYNLKMFMQLMRLSYGRKVLDVMDLVDELAGIGRERQKNFLVYALRLIRENFILNANRLDLIFLSDEEMDFSKKFSQFINEKNVWEIAEELNEANYHIERNGAPKIIFLDLALRLIKLLRS